MALAYLSASLLFRSFPLRAIGEALVWPPLGLGLAALVIFGLRLWPGLVAGVLLEAWLAEAGPAGRLGPALGTVAATLGAAVVLKRAGFHGALWRVRDVLLLMGVAVLGGAFVHAAVGGVVGLLTGALSWTELPGRSFSAFRASALGVVLVAPLLLTWASEEAFSWFRARRAESLAYLGGLLGVTYFATGAVPAPLRTAFPTRYLVFPFLFWGAVRMGPSAVATANVLVVAVSAAGRWLAEGALPGEPVADRMVLLWSYSLFGSVTGLFLAANTKERKTARRQAEVIAEANTDLTRSLDKQAVFETLLTALARLVPYDTANVLLREEGFLVWRAGRGGVRPDGVGSPGPFPIVDARWWDRLQQGSLLIADLRAARDAAEVLGGSGVGSLVAVPLRAGGEWIGLYTLGKAEPGFFTAEHLHLAESLSAQGAVAISNARLYEQSRRDQEALRASEAKFLKAFRSSP
ncbi:MAG TPA: MASE1 domain-containing protein, partial [Vicinamibacteria bacterium]